LAAPDQVFPLKCLSSGRQLSINIQYCLLIGVQYWHLP
jgi:hypothetical protein